MKLFLPFFLLIASPLWSQDLDAQRKNSQSSAEKNQVELRLDQPYAGNENAKQRVDLYLPKKRNTDKPLPVVALIHGGGWVNGDRLGYAAAAIQFSRTGDYAAVTVGYRLTKEAHWPAQVYDCKAAIRWIRAHAKEFNLDPDKIAVMGSSAGGHLSSLLGTSGDVKVLEGDLGPNTTFSSRVQCVVNLCGPEDFTQARLDEHFAAVSFAAHVRDTDGVFVGYISALSNGLQSVFVDSFLLDPEYDVDIVSRLLIRAVMNKFTGYPLYAMPYVDEQSIFTNQGFKVYRREMKALAYRNDLCN